MKYNHFQKGKVVGFFNITLFTVVTTKPGSFHLIDGHILQ